MADLAIPSTLQFQRHGLQGAGGASLNVGSGDSAHPASFHLFLLDFGWKETCEGVWSMEVWPRELCLRGAADLRLKKRRSLPS